MGTHDIRDHHSRCDMVVDTLAKWREAGIAKYGKKEYELRKRASARVALDYHRREYRQYLKDAGRA